MSDLIFSFRKILTLSDLYDTGICVKTLALCDEKKLNIFPWNAILLGFLDSYWLMELKSFALSKTCTTFIIAHLHTHLHTHLNVRYQISDFYLTTGHCQILFDPFAMKKLCDVTKINKKVWNKNFLHFRSNQDLTMGYNGPLSDLVSPDCNEFFLWRHKN